MSVAPIRPLTAAEAAMRVELAPQPPSVARPATVRAVLSPQGASTDQVELRSRTTTAVQTPGEAPVERSPASAVRTALQVDVTRQSGLGPLLADLAEVVRTSAIPLPLRTAAIQLMAAQPNLPMQPTAVELRRALARSGLFLEARLASALPPEPGDPSPRMPPLSLTAAFRGDAKAHLLAFRGVLQSWLATQPATAPAGPTEVRALLAPPYAEGPTRGQPPATSSIPADAPAAAVAQRLMQAADGALARQELLQIASLPDASDSTGARGWMFELPIDTLQGRAIAHFEITRDGGRGASSGEGAPVWRSRFSLDVEPLGPVHAHVALRAGHVNVSLWAERPEIAELLSREGDALVAALRRSDMTADLLVREGSPRARPAAAGQFVDEAT